MAWLAVTLVVLGALVLPSASRAAQPRGTALPVGKGTEGVWGFAPVVADGRIWQLSGTISPLGFLTLRSWPLRGGTGERQQPLERVSTRPIAPLPGTTNTYSADLPREFVGWFGVAGGKAYARASVCPNDAPEYCTPESRTFVFDAASGNLLQAYPWNSGPVPLALQPGMLLVSWSDDRSTIEIEDPAMNERFGPRPAAEAQWTYVGSAALRTRESKQRATHDVIDYRTGAVRYSVSDQALLRAARQPSAKVEGVGLQPDGSLAVFLRPRLTWSARAERQYRRGPVPVYVDADGRVRRAGPRMKGAVEVSAVPSGNRVIVASDGGQRGKGRMRRAVCTGAWVVDRSGERGYALSTERGAGRLRVAGVPAFWDGATGIWSREQSGSGKETYIVRQLDGLTLRASQRPSCAGGARPARLSSEFDR